MNRGKLKVDGEAVGANLLTPPPAADLGLQALRDSGRGPAGAAGAVVQPVGAELGVAAPPLGGALAADADRLGYVGDGRAGLDAAIEQESTLGSEGGVTVAHEDLRGVVLAWTPAHLQPEVFALVDPYRVTNVRERNT